MFEKIVVWYNRKSENLTVTSAEEGRSLSSSNQSVITIDQFRIRKTYNPIRSQLRTLRVSAHQSLNTANTAVTASMLFQLIRQQRLRQRQIHRKLVYRSRKRRSIDNAGKFQETKWWVNVDGWFTIEWHEPILAGVRSTTPNIDFGSLANKYLRHFLGNNLTSPRKISKSNSPLSDLSNADKLQLIKVCYWLYDWLYFTNNFLLGPLWTRWEMQWILCTDERGEPRVDPLIRSILTNCS